jgi:intracellular septation protein A
VTLIQQAPVTAIAPAHPAPHVRDIVARVVVSVVTAVVAPAVLFATNLVLFNLATAMIVALVWMAGVMTWRHATGRPLSGLLLLTAVIMVVKTSIALATGNSFIYFVQPAIVDVTVAACFLGSLWSSRPLVARLAPDFYPMDADVAARPAIGLLFRRLTLLWGLVILTKGCITLWLLVSLSTVDFVLIKGCAIISLTLTAAAATVVWSILVGRREGLFPGHHPVDVIEGFGVPVVLDA